MVKYMIIFLITGMVKLNSKSQRVQEFGNVGVLSH
jgi:hypothetical protein